MRAANLLLLVLGATSSVAVAQESITITGLSSLNTASTTDDSTTTKTSAKSSATTTDASTTDSSASTTTDSSASSAFSTTTGSTASSGSSSTTVSHLSDLPTLAGATVPTMIVPYTADAPFMQKSSYPEGTVFICVGAILGFLGLCVLAWRALVAYTINRSVKKAALASIMASDSKTWMNNIGTGAAAAAAFATKRGPGGGAVYKRQNDGSSLSLEPLTPAGKAARKSAHMPNPRKEQARDPSSLFFSPTAAGAGMQQQQQAPPQQQQQAHNRSTSAYLPAGYYALPSAQAAGGAATTTLGSGTTRPTPPGSPTLRPTSTYLRPGSHARDHSQTRKSWAGAAVAVAPPSTSAAAAAGAAHRGGTSSHAAHNYSNSAGANQYLGTGGAPLYAQPSSSSLLVGNGLESDLGLVPGQRAPSAVFDDLLENHGNGPRERF